MPNPAIDISPIGDAVGYFYEREERNARKLRNMERAARGASLITNYSNDVVQSDNPDAPATDDLYDDAQTVLADMMTDIYHHCAEANIDFSAALAQAMRAYSQEKI